MASYKNSALLPAAINIADRITDRFRGGVIHRLCINISRSFGMSLTHRILSSGNSPESAWEHSVFYKAASSLVNLIPNLLHRLYANVKGPAETSLFCRYALPFFGKSALPLSGLLMLFMLIAPQEKWNNLYSLIITAVAFIMFYASCFTEPGKKADLASVGPWPVIFAFMTLLSLFWSKDFSMSLRFFFLGVTCMIKVILTVSAANDPRDLFRLIWLAAIGLCISSLYAVFQNYAGVEADEILTDLSLFGSMPGRVYSFFENPNSYANILVFFAPLMLAMTFYSPGTLLKICFGAVFALCCAALMMTYARGGYLALLFALFVLMLILCPKRVPFLIVLGFIAVPFLPASILNRLLSIFSASDSSTYTRGYIYSAMLGIIGKNPIYGVGLGPDALRYAIELSGVYKAQAVFIHAHNIYFQIWAEMGIFGLISFICAMFFTMRSGVRSIKKCTSPLLKGIIAGCVSGLAGSLIFGMTDYAWSYPRVMVMFWFVFAILAAAVKLSRVSGCK